VTAAADGSFSCTLPAPLPDGPAVIEVTATDPAGNESPTTEVPITVDTVAPDAPVVTRPADGEAVDTATPTVEGTAEPGSTVTVDAGDGNTCTATAGADGHFSCTLPALPEGPAVIEVTATDPAGNVSEPVEKPIVVDTVKPAAPVVTRPTEGESLDTAASVTVEGTAEPGSTVMADAGDGNACTTTAGADGAFSCTLPRPLPEGPKVIEVVSVDAAGNVSDSTFVHVNADSSDTTPPAAPTVDTSDPDAIHGTSDPDTTVTVKDDDGNLLCSVQTNSDGKWSCTPAEPLHPGDEITVTATDPSGNETSLTVRVLGIAVKVSSLPPGDEQTATGSYFQPGEQVTAVMCSPSCFAIGQGVAQADGTVVFTWVIPADAELGPHEVILTGEISGPVIGHFQVTPPAPVTGSAVSPGFTTAAGLVLLLGLALLVLSRRRREEDETGLGRYAL
jgi:LPXTG-motif cell wall-anchored protein